MDVHRLKKLRQSSSSKLDVLSKLDENMIELVNVEELEGEVKQPNLLKVKVSFAVVSIDKVLEAIMRPLAGPRTNP